MERIREEMKKYYHNRLLVDGHLNNKECDEQFKKLRGEILEEVEEFYSNNKSLKLPTKSKRFFYYYYAFWRCSKICLRKIL